MTIKPMKFLKELIDELADRLDNLVVDIHDSPVPLPPKVQVIDDILSYHCNFDNQKPFIVLFVRNIKIKNFTYGSSIIEATISVVVNDSYQQNIFDTIDAMYNVFIDTFDELNSKYLDTGVQLVLQDMIDIYHDAKLKELGVRYSIDLKVLITASR